MLLVESIFEKNECSKLMIVGGNSRLQYDIGVVEYEISTYGIEKLEIGKLILETRISKANSRYDTCRRVGVCRGVRARRGGQYRRGGARNLFRAIPTRRYCPTRRAHTTRRIPAEEVCVTYRELCLLSA